MMGITPANLIAYGAQITIVAVAGGALLALFRTQPPHARYTCWRALLALCLALPWLQTPGPAPPAVPLENPPVPASVGASTAPMMTLPPISYTWVDWMGPVLITGIALRLAWLAVGCLRLARLRRRGRPAIDPRFDELARAIGVRAELRYVPGLPQPVMFGVMRPIVLLPDRLRDADDDIRVAVAAHELWHVRRRDWLSLVAEEIVRAALWCQPAIWWLIARIRASREEVVDALAVGVTGRPSAYVRALMTFADVQPLAGAAAFGWKRHLFRRIVQISREDVMSSPRLIASLVALAAFVGFSSWSAVRAFPLTAAAPLEQTGPGPIERIAKPIGTDNPLPQQIRDARPVYPDDPAAREISAKVLIRTTVDQSGTVAEARVIRFSVQLTNPRSVTNPDGTTLTVRDGALTVDGDDAVQKLEAFLERAASPGNAPPLSNARYRPALRAFVDSALTAVRDRAYAAPANGPVTFDVAVMFDAGRTAAGHAVMERELTKFVASAGHGEPSLLADGAIRVGNAVKPPTKVRDVRPVYPDEARAAGIQGVVILEVRIEPDGQVSQARVLRSIPALDKAAVDAVRQWRFTETLLNGSPTPVVMTVTIQFSL